MNTIDIKDAVEFNSMLIATEIRDCEDILHDSTCSNYTHEMAKIHCYEHIAELIFAQEALIKR